MRDRQDRLKEEHERMKYTLLGIAFLMAFVFLVSMTVIYVRSNFGVGICSRGEGISLFIAVLSSLGVFVGTLVYYLFSMSRFREKENFSHNIRRTLDFLDADERKILTAIIDNHGEISQSSLSSLTGLDPVRVFRRISRLEDKGIVIRENNGMTKRIILNNDFKRLFMF